MQLEIHQVLFYKLEFILISLVFIVYFLIYLIRLLHRHLCHLPNYLGQVEQIQLQLVWIQKLTQLHFKNPIRVMARTYVKVPSSWIISYLPFILMSLILYIEVYLFYEQLLIYNPLMCWLVFHTYQGYISGCLLHHY